MARPMRTFADSILRFLSIYDATRNLYYRIVYCRTQKELDIADMTKKVWATTYASQIRVQNLSGEGDLMRRFMSLLRPGDIVWDVGANMGAYALFAAEKVGTHGHVYAFEPERKMHAALKSNVDLNSLTNVTPVAIALGDHDGAAALYRSAEAQTDGIHCLAPRSDYRVRQAGYRINLRKGDSLVQEGRVMPPTAVKVDVEGAELVVFRGMAEVLRTPNLRVLLCEVHPKVLPLFGGNDADIENLITEAGFCITYRSKRSSEYHLICEKRPAMQTI